MNGPLLQGLFFYFLHTTRFQSTDIFHMPIEVLDLDFFVEPTLVLQSL